MHIWKKSLNPEFALPVASLGEAGEKSARPGCHHFGVTLFYDTNWTKTKKIVWYISLEMFSTLEWTTTNLKHLLKHLFSRGQRWSQGHKARGEGQRQKKFRDQGQGQTLSSPRPKTKNTGASVLQKKRSSKIFFRQKSSSKIFFRRFPLEENKKRSSQIFLRGFWHFPTKFQRFKK